MIPGLGNTYKSIMGLPGTTINAYLIIQTDTVLSMRIGLGSIFDLRIYSMLFSDETLSIGGTAAKCLKCTFLPGSGTIPRMAKIIVSYILRGASGAVAPSVDIGPFYIDTREVDVATGKMTVTAYDIMLMTEQLIDLRSTTSPVITHTDAVSAIAAKLGIAIDDRSPTLLSANFTRLSTLTMRQILGRIAVLNCGNWVITLQGKLRLVPIDNTIADNCDMGDKAHSLSLGEAFDPITKLTVQLVENSTDEADIITVGDDTGRSLTVFCPWCTEANATAMLAKLRSASAVYIPYTAEGALIDVAYEIGDTVTWQDDKTTKYLIASQTIAFGRVPHSTLSAPGEKVIDHEYPYRNAR